MGRKREHKGHGSSRRKYAAIGFVVSKFVVPVVKRQARKRAKSAVKGTATSTVGAVKRHPGRTSIAVGSAIGAAGWLLTRGRRGDDADDHPAE